MPWLYGGSVTARGTVSARQPAMTSRQSPTQTGFSKGGLIAPSVCAGAQLDGLHVVEIDTGDVARAGPREECDLIAGLEVVGRRVVVKPAPLDRLLVEADAAALQTQL